MHPPQVALRARWCGPRRGRQVPPGARAKSPARCAPLWSFAYSMGRAVAANPSEGAGCYRESCASIPPHVVRGAIGNAFAKYAQEREPEVADDRERDASTDASNDNRDVAHDYHQITIHSY